MKVLILRLEAPLMSFGTVAVDKRRPSGPFPALSAVTGLLGAALGIKRHQTDALQRLQERLRLASRLDRRGVPLTDYQTVDLGQPWMDGSEKGVGWTTRHRVEARGKGSSNRGTHIRYRQYWADAIATLAVSLEPAAENPTLGDLAAALMRPCHPLFIGRKSCPPAAPILVGEREAESLREALAAVPAHPRADGAELPAQWPAGEAEGYEEQVLWDRRDWPNQIHAGSRRAWRGSIRLQTAEEDSHG
ncbi:MAG: type I-E CRISPR-associated protein Cas5/CasD [Immundisolibacter sp.]